jgi:PAS domain S-box-containing protein
VAERRASIDLTQTLENVRVPSAIADQRGTITWLNAAARDAFGDLRGRPFVSVVAPEHVAVVERERQRMLDGAPVTDYEVDVLTVDGRRHAQISSVPIEGGDACHAVFGVAVTRPTRRSAASAHLTPRHSEVLRLLEPGSLHGRHRRCLASEQEDRPESRAAHPPRAPRAFAARGVASAHRQGLLDDVE